MNRAIVLSLLLFSSFLSGCRGLNRLLGEGQESHSAEPARCYSWTSPDSEYGFPVCHDTPRPE
jgi:hypothetical protein